MYKFKYVIEEVIWRKLLIDGDGIGDDRRLNILLKSYLKWCNTKYTDPVERYIKILAVEMPSNITLTSTKFEVLIMIKLMNIHITHLFNMIFY